MTLEEHHSIYKGRNMELRLSWLEACETNLHKDTGQSTAQIEFNVIILLLRMWVCRYLSYKQKHSMLASTGWESASEISLA